MKKAIKINLGGLIFHIDEDAYDCLKNYLAMLSNHFGQGSESKEIVDDVEARIADLFQQKISNSKQVINLSDVENVIAILGNPSDFDDKEEYKTTTNTENKEQTQYQSKKRFYRDVDNSVIGGVCAGMGAYFNTDPVIFRILFVALTFAGFAAVPIYIILWIALPAANTAAQKLEMRGEPVNVSNIGKTVQEEYNQSNQSRNDDKNRNKARDFFEEFLEVCKTIFKAILKVFGVFFGVLLTIIGIVLIVALIIASTHQECSFSNSNVHIHNFPFLMHQFVSPGTSELLIFLLVVIALIPVIGLLYLGLKLIFKFRLNDRYFWLTAVGAWIIAIVVFVVFLATGFRSFADETSQRTTVKLEPFTSNTLYLNIANKEIDDKSKTGLIEIEDKEEYFVTEKGNMYGRPKVRIIKTSANNFSVEIEKEANGSSITDAENCLKKIEYSVKQQDSIINIDPYYDFGKNSKWRAQNVELIIKVPEGKMVHIDQSLLPFLDEVMNDEDYEFSEIAGKTLIMKAEGLEKIKNN
jgi:phage shock protein PspC (stress-responsive transcriptional regulator)